jgi:Tol biopolymer transport system component
VPGDTGAAYPVWSPDSKSILFGLGAYRIDSWGIVSAVPEQASSPIVLPLIELEKGGLADLTPGAWDANNRILFSAKSGDSSNVFELALSPPNVLSKQWRLGSSPVRLTSGTEQDEKPSLAAAVGNSRRLAFTSLVRSENLWGLALDPNQPRTGGKIQRLTEAAGAFHIFPEISSDGTKVVYVSHAAYNDEVWVLDLKTGKTLKLPAPVSVKLFKSHIFADGSRVYFGDGASSPGWIYAVSTSGGALEKLCGGSNAWTWDWSLDHRRILHYDVRRGSSSVVVGVLNLDTCQDSVLLERAGSDIYDVRWSPDGRWVAFNTAKGVDRQTYVVPFTGDQGPDDRSWIPITDGSAREGHVQWSPDGNWLYLLSDRDGFQCIWAYPLDPRSKKPAGPPVAVFHSHGARLALNNANDVSFGLSAARDKIIFNQGEITGNIWLTTLPEN